MGVDAAPQGAFGGGLDRVGVEPGPADALPVGIGGPGRPVGEVPGAPAFEPGDHRPGQAVVAHVGQGVGMGRMVVVAGAQQPGKIPAALGGGGGEGGNPTGRQAHHLALRDGHAHAAREGDARGGDLPSVMLQQDETHRPGTGMTLQAGRQRGHGRPARRGQPAFPALADHPRLQAQLPKGEAVMAFAAPARRRLDAAWTPCVSSSPTTGPTTGIRLSTPRGFPPRRSRFGFARPPAPCPTASAAAALGAPSAGRSPLRAPHSPRPAAPIRPAPPPADDAARPATDHPPWAHRAAPCPGLNHILASLGIANRFSTATGTAPLTELVNKSLTWRPENGGQLRW